MYLVPCLTSIWSDDKALPVNIYTPPIIDRKFQHLTSTGLSQNNHNVKRSTPQDFRSAITEDIYYNVT